MNDRLNSRRSSDVLVAVLSFKEGSGGSTFAELIASQINAIFEKSLLSVQSIGLSKFDGHTDRMIKEASIIIVDKSLGRDPLGTKVDGIEAIEEIRNLHPTKMIIAMSSSFTPEQRSRLASLGVAFFAKKPIYIFAFREMIEACINMISVQRKLDDDFWSKGNERR